MFPSPRAAAMLLALSTSALAQPLDPKGTWLVEDKDGIVQIGDCGRMRRQPATGTLCGTVAWIRDPIDRATGKPPVDARNTDRDLRGRPILGLPVVMDMKPSDTPGRFDGRVYNIDDGKTYSGKLMLGADERLRVEGCVLLVCRGETWTRQALPEMRAPRPPSSQDRAR